MSEHDWLAKAADSFNRKLVIISPDFTILAANRCFTRIAGGKKLGDKCYTVLYGRDEPCVFCPAAKTLQSGKPTAQLASEDASDANGENCLYSIPIAPNGNMEALVVLDLNIPAMKGIEDQLERSNAFLKNLLLSSVDGVIAADMTGKVILFNEAASRIYGLEIEEALKILNIRQVYPGDGARSIMKVLRSEEHGGKGKLHSYKVDVLNKKGELIPISLNASIVYDDGREMATIGFFRDLREHLRMEEELKNTQVQLLQAEKLSSLGKLAAGVAHQLNNPLGGIILFTKLALEEYELPDKLKADLNRILDDAQRSRDIVRELLEFARQTKRMKAPQDINRALGRTLFLLENQAIFHNITIVKDLSPELPPVSSDVQQLYHLFMNIILNAVEAMGQNGRLTVGTRPSGDGKRAVITISDTGPGIPESALPHIFEPFFTTKEEGKGTGLGLSLAYNIVANHKGRISVSSKKGKGTTFLIELPIAEKENGK